MLTLTELRAQFEVMAELNKFDVELDENFEYKTEPRNTFLLWAGYWECAKINGVIDKKSMWIDAVAK